MSTPRGLTFEEARRAILSTAADVERRVSVRPIESALEHALAEPIQSSIALPPWNNAGMDGYAVRRADVIGATAQAPVVLPVIATSMAGADVTTLPVVRPGTSVRIMTGAPMPPEADAVIRIEDTDGGSADGGSADGGSANGGSTQVTITDARDAIGRGNVRPRGEDVAEGAQLFAAGTTIRAAHLGVLASIGCATVRVFERPRVTILSSGDELVLLDRFHEVAAGKRIIASSSYALPPLLRSAGADVTVAPIAEDSLAGMTAAVAAALERGCDLLVTTGGISVGAHDFTRDAIDANGGVQTFWRAKIRPGGPVGTGRIATVPWIGLPGNPVSTLVTATLFAWPLIRALGGHARVLPTALPVRMMDRAETPAPLSYFLRVALSTGDDGTLEARLAGAQGSNLLSTMAHTDALLQIPADCDTVTPGMLLPAILLPEAPLLMAPDTAAVRA